MSNKDNFPAPAKGQFLVYQAEDGELQSEVTHKKFLLDEKATVKNYLTVQWQAAALQAKWIISTVKKFLIVLMRENGDASA